MKSGFALFLVAAFASAHAHAELEGNDVLVSSDVVAKPSAVRYAWKDAPEAVLFNGAGLPAAPFQSKIP